MRDYIVRNESANDMDVNTTRFDHKASNPDRCRSYLRVWWALHGWAISNGWRLRRVWEAEDAENPEWAEEKDKKIGVFITPRYREMLDQKSKNSGF